MARSLALWLALFSARGGAPAPEGAAAPAGPAAPEGTGPLVWLNPGQGARVAGLVQLAQQMRRARRELRFALTLDPRGMRRRRAFRPAPRCCPPRTRPSRRCGPSWTG